MCFTKLQLVSKQIHCIPGFPSNPCGPWHPGGPMGPTAARLHLGAGVGFGFGFEQLLVELTKATRQTEAITT